MKQRLAQIAESEVKMNYHGNTDAAISNLQPLADLFEEVDGMTLDTLNADWSGAFAFLCVQKAGFGLPLAYPDPRVGESFASVAAWERYARLPKIRLWHPAGEEPEVGDLAILEAPIGKPPRMGIVLRVNGTEMELAVGNYGNHSALISHPCYERVRGFVRLREDL